MEKEILSLETAKKLADYEKLQKENEELKEENFNLKEEKMIDKSSCKPLNNFYDYYDCISKDKIRKKIKELEYLQDNYPGRFKELNKLVGDERYAIEALKELLKEE